MEAEKIIELLGHSHKNRIANERIAQFGFTIPSVEEEYSGVPYHIPYEHDSLNIVLTFNGYNYYKTYYGEPKGYTEQKKNELILYEIAMDYRDTGLSNKKELTLPFNFKFGDCEKDILEAVTKDYTTTIRFIEDQSITFFKDDYQVVVSFDEEAQIELICITLINIEEKIRLKLELELEFQKSNIESDNVDKLLALKNTFPTLDWDYQAKLGVKKSKQLVRNIFDQFIKSLSICMIDKDPVQIYVSVKETILKLNEAKNAGLIIDTVEREELCEAIDVLVKATGFRIYDGVDITSKWRQW